MTLAAANGGFYRRIANYVFYLVMATLAAPFLPRVDVVVSTAPQFFCGLAGYLVSRIRRVPWVLEIRDLWPESIVAVGAMRDSRAIRFLERLESFAYRKADRIISVTNSFQLHIVEQGGRAKKIAVIRNGVDLRLFDPDRVSNTFAAEHGLEGKFIASYVHTHEMAHGLDTILHAADKLRDRDDIDFLMVGEGAERDRIANLRTEMDLQNVVMLGQQPKFGMPEVWGSTAASLVLLRDQKLFRSVIPSKIFESMVIKKPVLLGVRGESQQIIKESAGRMCIAPEHADELAGAVKALADDRAKSHAMGVAGRQFVEKNFDRGKFAEEYELLIDELLATESEALETGGEG